MATGFDHDRPADGHAPLGEILAGPPPRELPRSTIENLRHASAYVRESERLIRRALDHDCPTAVADAIAVTKRALDHLIAIR